MNLNLIPKTQPWLVVIGGVITSAHVSPGRAGAMLVVADATLGACRVLEQAKEREYHIGQRVMSVRGEAVPCVNVPTRITLG